MIFFGFIQAGGGSTRFGTDKALVELAGKTMLRRTGELLESICDDVAVVTSAGRYQDLEWRTLSDLWPGQGPLSGILTVLHRLNDAKDPYIGSDPEILALILSCDMPFLTREFLADMRERASRSNALVVVPRSANGLEPLCACWRPIGAAVLQDAYNDGVRKVTEAMKRLPMEVLDESAWKRFDSHNRLFWNMNTHEDYEEARRILETETR